MTITYVPEAWVALIQLFTVSLPQRQIFDGGPTTDEPDRFVVVGRANEHAPAAQVSQQIPRMGNYARDENFVIECEIAATSGHPDLALLRADVSNDLDVLAAALANNRTLGGVLTVNGWAGITGMTWYTAYTSLGVQVSAYFSVQCYVPFFLLV